MGDCSGRVCSELSNARRGALRCTRRADAGWRRTHLRPPPPARRVPAGGASLPLCSRPSLLTLNVTDSDRLSPNASSTSKLAAQTNLAAPSPTRGLVSTSTPASTPVVMSTLPPSGMARLSTTRSAATPAALPPAVVGVHVTLQVADAHAGLAGTAPHSTPPTVRDVVAPDAAEVGVARGVKGPRTIWGVKWS